jgi:iron complex outermembrane receptor protein
MKKLYKYLLTVTLSTTSLIGYSQNELRGKVISIIDSTIIPDVSIYIPELKIGAVTDATGMYTIKNISDGTYLIDIRQLGYAAQAKEITVKGLTVADLVLVPSNKELQEVVVTGVFSATEQQTNPIPISVMSQKELLQNSSTNIIDAIARMPGVSQITEGPAISKPVIRGLGYNRVVVMNDGVRQEGQQWGDEFGIEVDEYTVNKVEILKGPASLSYGSDAMAGVLNMIDAPTLPQGQIKGNIITNYQSNNGLMAGSANLAGNSKGISWDVRYTNKNAHAYKDKYDGYVWNSGYGENDVKGTVGINRKWGYSRVTLSSFDLSLGIVEGARDSATGKFDKHVLGSNNSDSLAIVPSNQYTQYNYNNIVHQHVRHHKAVWDNNIALGGGHLKLTLGWQQNFRQEANDITKGNIYNLYFFLNTLNYNLQYVLPEKNHLEVSFGVNGMKQFSENRGLVFLVPAYNLFDIGAFSIAKKSFNKLSISGGIRYQSRSLHGNALYLDSAGNKLSGNQPGAVNRFSSYNSNFTGMAGSIGLTYDFTKHFYGKANLSRGFRAPNIAESGSNGIHDGTPFYEIGDPTLKPEISTQLDATIGLTTENFTAEINVFDNNINNYIFPVKLESTKGGDSIRTDVMAGMSGPTFKYIAGNAVLYGGEAVLNIHPKTLKWVRLENSFSMVNSVQKNQPDSTKYLPYTPPYKLLSQVVLSLKKANKTFKNLYVKAGVNHYFEQDKIYYKFGNETVTPQYTLINLGFGTDICSKTHTLCSIYVYASNITNVAYQSNMSRLKYTDPNNVTGRVGVYNMGRNISFKLVIPIDVKK